MLKLKILLSFLISFITSPSTLAENSPIPLGNAYLSEKNLSQLAANNISLQEAIASMSNESKKSLFYSFPRDNNADSASCKQKPLSPELLTAATKKASQIQAYLNETDPTVVLLARVGSDVSKYNMHYTHLAFALRHPSNGEWGVIQLLNTCSTSTSRIYEQGLANFLLDNLFSLDVKMIVPTPDVQNKLAAVLASSKVTSFHNKNYSMIAYPFSTQYQQSNQWVLELLVSALFGANDREAAQEYLKATAFTPTLIPINSFSKFGANIFRKNVSFDDHPDREATEGKYSVVTVDSIVDYLKKQHLISTEKEFRDKDTQSN
jgi:hypothetical protein